jgi:DNA-binding GntR family transcriptional regulator
VAGGATPVEPVRGERTGDVVARRLGQAILEGTYPPGTRLREATLAQTYAVSRTPIREALILLGSSGLVEINPNRGATVLRLSIGDVSEIYHLRAVLESEAARLAAKRITPEVVDVLDKTCDLLAELHGAAATDQLAADTDFHYRIAEESGSARLHALIRQVSAIPEAYRSSIAYTSADMTDAERQHRAIAAALRQHRSAEAGKLMHRHVDWAGRLAVRRLERWLRAD